MISIANGSPLVKGQNRCRESQVCNTLNVLWVVNGKYESWLQDGVTGKSGKSYNLLHALLLHGRERLILHDIWTRWGRTQQLSVYKCYKHKHIYNMMVKLCNSTGPRRRCTHAPAILSHKAVWWVYTAPVQVKQVTAEVNCSSMDHMANKQDQGCSPPTSKEYLKTVNVSTAQIFSPPSLQGALCSSSKAFHSRAVLQV